MSCTVTQKTENILVRTAVVSLAFGMSHMGLQDVDMGEWKGQEVVGQTEKSHGKLRVVGVYIA